ncbi:MAG: hypothetical protein KAT43_00955 [Nanoarchaeota archaeon]|nr:hypothetical protein [Nanoarchaeota archaeon]
MQKPSTIDFKVLERRTMAEWGIETLSNLHDIGYNVWVTPKKTLGYESSTCGRGCDGGVCCGQGKGRFTVLPNRKGCIEEFEFEPKSVDWTPYFEMYWYTKDEIAMRIEEDNRFDDLIVIAMPASNYLVHQRYEILENMITAANAEDTRSLDVLNKQFEKTMPDIDVLPRTRVETEYDNCRQSCLLSCTMFVDDRDIAIAHAEKQFAKFVDPEGDS